MGPKKCVPNRKMRNEPKTELSHPENTRRSFFSDALFTLAAAAILVWPAHSGQSNTVTDWPSYGGDPGGSRFSPLTQINRQNVHKLKVAWTYHTGDVSDGAKYARKSAFETTPILVDGTLYFSTAFNRVIALDPET